MSETGCHACGVCCELFGHTVTATENDFNRWLAEDRREITSWAATPVEERQEGCPFLERDEGGEGSCSIHDTKPEMCRAYPTELHGGWCVMKVKHETRRSGGK